MKIKWLGHSCFKIKSDRGIRIVTDPFDDNVGYKIPLVETDIVTISHGHYDHNFIDCIKGKFETVDKVGNFYVKDIPISGIHTFHDEVQGEKRGNNIVYTMDLDGIRVCHLGDLGHLLTEAEISMIGSVDVLLIPVGGTYTINSEEAAQIIDTLKPSVVIPMHYKTPALKFNLDGVDSFLERVGNYERINSSLLEIKKENLDRNNLKVYLLKYE